MRGVIRGDERGQVLALLAILLPMFLGMGGLVVAGGNWFTHAKHLQTKADAGALAAGQDWAFPCGPDIDRRIAATARRYAGPLNPQVGSGADGNVRVVLNNPDWYATNDVLPICDTMRLDVKATEVRSFPLFSLLPFFPDIKRKAVVEIREGESFGGAGLLPIAVRAPLPLPAAVFYNEANGQILDVKYFVESTSNGLGWSTSNPESTSPWARFSPAATTGVAIAISFRGACDTNLPSQNTLIPISPAPCFEDEGFTTVNQLCNQGSIPIVRCYFGQGHHPVQRVQAGLHFIRGYADANPGTGPPAVEGAWLENLDCLANAYFNWQRTDTSGQEVCRARLQLRVDVGTLVGAYDGGQIGIVEGPVRASDVEVRFRLVRGNGTAQCDFGRFCDLIGGGVGPNLSFATQGTPGSPDLELPRTTAENAVAIQVRLRNAVNSSNVNCRGDAFNNNCRYFYTGTGLWTGQPEVPPDDAILGAPVQRSFRGTTTTASSVQYLRLTADENCDGNRVWIDGPAASQQLGGNPCFVVDMKLKGGIAQDVDDQPIIFNDGTGASQTGALDCDPSVPQGQALVLSVANGCGPWYARHSFDFPPPLCPHHNNIFAQPNPGPPWDDWPPLQCVKTRPTSQATQFQDGFLLRLFGGSSSCPPDAPGFVKGRNYWNPATNPLNNGVYGYRNDNPRRDTYFHPADPRVVTIFLVPTWTFTRTGQRTFPIAGFIQVYVTGFGHIDGGGRLRNDDPCPGNTPPPESEYECRNVDCGYVVWGHFMNYVVPSSGARPAPDGRRCDPDASVQPCVAVLVE